MLTKGAIGNLVNRYRAVLKKCNLINTFGSLAVASMLVLGGASVAEAETNYITETLITNENIIIHGENGSSPAIDATNKNIEVSGCDSISLDGVWTNTNDRNIFFTRKTTDDSSLIIGSIKKPVSIVDNNNFICEVTNYDEGKGYGSIVFHAWSAPMTVYAKDIVLTNYANAFYAQDAAKLTVHADNITLTTQGVWGTIGIGTNSDTAYTAPTTEISITATSLNINTTQGTAISAQSGYNGTGTEKAVRGSITLDVDNIDIVAKTGIKAINVEEHAERANISIDANTLDINTSKHAIFAEKYANIEITTTEATTIISEDTAIYANNSDVSITSGASSITGGTNAIELTNGSTVTLSADTYNITGDIVIDALAPAATLALTSSTPAPSKLVFNGGAGQVDGNIDAENGGIDLNNGAELGLGDGSDNSIGELGGNGAFLLNDKNTKLAVNKLASGSTAKAKATPKLNDELSGNAEEFKKQLKLGNNKAGVDVDALFGGMEEGLVAGAVDASGKQSKNRIMDAALKQASVATVALDKILTNDVRKRLGDIRSDKNQTGVWMRWDGGKLKGDSGLTNNFNTIQIGGDTKVGTNCRIGVAGSFTHGDTDFARGNGELEGFSFALYSTWMGENGMFADIVTRLGHFSNEMNVEGLKGDMDNRVFSLSGEYGWRFDLCKQFFLEPQVELAYTYVSSDDLQLDTAHYEFDSVNSLTGRAGLVAGWNLPDDMGSVYARASVLQQFMGDAKIIGANGGKPITQELDGDDTWMEYGIGANIKLTDKTYIWADVERTAGADLDEEWRGTVGLRYSF